MAIRGANGWWHPELLSWLSAWARFNVELAYREAHTKADVFNFVFIDHNFTPPSSLLYVTT
jgi:hypothetical protein